MRIVHCLNNLKLKNDFFRVFLLSGERYTKSFTAEMCKVRISITSSGTRVINEMSKTFPVPTILSIIQSKLGGKWHICDYILLPLFHSGS